MNLKNWRECDNIKINFWWDRYQTKKTVREVCLKFTDLKIRKKETKAAVCQKKNQNKQ